MSLVRPLLASAAAAVLGLALSGCGKVGLLEQPAPMWGEKAKAEYQARKAAAAAAASEGQHQAPEALPETPPLPDGAATPVPSVTPAPAPPAQAAPPPPAGSTPQPPR